MRRERPHSGHAPARSVRLIALLAVVAIAAVLFRQRDRLFRHPPSPPSPDTPPAAGAALEDAVVREFVALESAEGEIARTLLAPEIRAQELGTRIEDLWDALNASTNPLATLHDAPFRSLALPPATAPEPRPHGIRRFTGRMPANPEPWPQARTRLDQARRDGWQLERSEWRHVQFLPASPDTPKAPEASRFEVRLHLTRTLPPVRAQIHARLRLDWPAASASPPTPPDSPTLGDAVVEDFELLVRDGPPAFEPAETRELQPFPRTTWIDPLILHDLDRDGSPEILLVARNLVLRRAADGRWAESPLTSHHPGLLFTALLADFTGDGQPDLLCAVRSGLILLRGGPTGAFDSPAVPAWTAPTRLHYAQAFTGGDFDADGDLDVFLGQYRTPYEGGQMPRPFFDALDGPPAYLLRNDGAGTFSEVTADSGLEPKRHRRSYAASFVDLDGDADLDLWVSSDFAGADVWTNDGRGRFTDTTHLVLDDPRAFGMSHTFSDFDSDGHLDALLLGMPQPTADRLDALGLERPGHASWRPERERLVFGNRLFFGDGKVLRQRPHGRDLARAGWAWSATALDLDNDRFPDLHVVNGHETRQSVRDYEREFWTHDIYVGNSTPRPAVDAYFAAKFTTARSQGWSYGGHDQNRFYLNTAGTGFLEAGHLLGIALPADSRNALAEDLDADGDLDLLVTTFEIWPRPRQTLRIFENKLGPVGNWIALRLPVSPPAPPPFGVSATIHDRHGSQTRVAVTGDGYRSQALPVLRFGLGDVARVDRAEVRWPGGRIVQLEGLEANRFHEIPAPPAAR